MVFYDRLNRYERLQDRCDRLWIAGTKQVSIPAILIVAIARIVPSCFHKIAGIAGISGVIHRDINDRNDYMEPGLKLQNEKSEIK